LLERPEENGPGAPNAGEVRLPCQEGAVEAWQGTSGTVTVWGGTQCDLVTTQHYSAWQELRKTT